MGYKLAALKEATELLTIVNNLDEETCKTIVDGGILKTAAKLITTLHMTRGQDYGKKTPERE